MTESFFPGGDAIEYDGLAPAGAETSAEDSPSSVSAWQPSRRLIVLLEDNNELREILARMLEIEGYDVVPSANPFEVLMLLETVQPSLLITDVLMSGMSGITLTRQIRSSPGIAWLPVLVFSASDARDAAFDAGADAYIGKESMDWPDLRDAIVSLIGRGVPRSERRARASSQVASTARTAI